MSQELLNSVRRAKSELRRTTGSEPKKLMDVAEYRSFPVQQEQDMRENSWRSIIHNDFKQSLIFVPTTNATSVFLRVYECTFIHGKRCYVALVFIYHITNFCRRVKFALNFETSSSCTSSFDFVFDVKPAADTHQP